MQFLKGNQLQGSEVREMTVFLIAVGVSLICIIKMKKICPEGIGAYVPYVCVVLLLLALVIGSENAW